VLGLRLGIVDIAADRMICGRASTGSIFLVLNKPPGKDSKEIASNVHHQHLLVIMWLRVGRRTLQGRNSGSLTSPVFEWTVMDRTVGCYAYGNKFWWLYLNLDLGRQMTSLNWTDSQVFSNLETRPSLSIVMVMWSLASGWHAASRLSPVDSEELDQLVLVLCISALCFLLLLHRVLSSVIDASNI